MWGHWGQAAQHRPCTDPSAMQKNQPAASDPTASSPSPCSLQPTWAPCRMLYLHLHVPHVRLPLKMGLEGRAKTQEKTQVSPQSGASQAPVLQA